MAKLNTSILPTNGVGDTFTSKNIPVLSNQSVNIISVTFNINMESVVNFVLIETNHIIWSTVMNVSII